MPDRINVGGGAAGAGFAYQARVGAWMVVSMLAGGEAPLNWNLGGSIVDSVQFELQSPVDDLLISLSGGERLRVQAKRTLTLSQSKSSAFGDSLDQVVRQHLQERGQSNLDGPLVVATRNPPRTIVRLSNLLDRYRYAPAQPAANELGSEDARVLNLLNRLLKECWLQQRTMPPSESDLADIRKRFWITSLEVEFGGAGERQALDRLARSVLDDPDRADAAWSAIIELCGQMIGARAGLERVALQRRLSEMGFALRAVRSYESEHLTPRRVHRPDIELAAAARISCE